MTVGKHEAALRITERIALCNRITAVAGHLDNAALEQLAQLVERLDAVTLRGLTPDVVERALAYMRPIEAW